MSSKERQTYQLLKKGFSKIEDGVISLASRFGKNIDKKTMPVVNTQSVDHQFYQLVEFGMNSIAEALSEIDVEIKDGEPGKDAVVDYDLIIEKVTPKKGVNYFTKEEVDSFVSKIQSEIKIPDPIPGKDAVVNYDKINEFVRKEVSQIFIPKGEKGDTPVVDYERIISEIVKKIVVPEPEKVDYDEVKKFIKKEIKDMPKGGVIRQFFSGGKGGGSSTLQEVTDNGATTDNVITGKAQPTFTYTSGSLTNITYDNGTEKDFTYNIDGTLNTLTITYPATTPIVKTFNWSSGVLNSIIIT